MNYKAGLVAIVLSCIVVSIVLMMTTDFVQTMPKIGERWRIELDSTNGEDHIQSTTQEPLYQRLQLLEQYINRAKLHVRGIKTSKELGKATTIMNEILEMFPKRDPLPLRKNVEPTSVCPEELNKRWTNKEWFRVKGCNNAKSFEQLITILMYIKDVNTTRINERVNSFLLSIPEEYQHVQVLIANSANMKVPTGDKTNIKMLTPTFKLSNIFRKDTDGDMWNMLIKKVTTPYVFVARDIDILSHDAQLDRLIREMETLQVPVAAGAVRYPNGHWKMGCFQAAYRNFTLKYFEGYDESFNECVFCDFSIGPFVTTLKTLEKFPFAGIYEDAGLFEDWFLRITRNNEETILCPDAMFHVHQRQEAKKWQTFMTKWNLLNIRSASGQAVTGDCTGDLLTKPIAKALSPCLMEENSQSVSTLMNICDNNTFICELNCGTLLGAVKFEHVLPWELDIDISVLHNDFQAYRDSLSKRFKLSSYKNNCDPRFYNVWFKHWRVDMCEMMELQSGQVVAGGFNQTKVLYNGHWMAAPRNPALFSRSVYGRGIFQHANHFTQVKDGDPTRYETNKFLPCRSPGANDCLDQYNGDGNLQFKYIMP